MTDDFKPLSSIPDTEPKRRRGRPPGSRNARSTKSLKKDLEGIITLANTVVMIVAPNDALDAVETEALATALDEQAKTNPRFRKMLESAVSVAGGSSLIVVVGMIVTRRLARHNIVPGGQMVDMMLGGVIRLSTLPPNQAAAAVEATAAQMSEAMARAASNDSPTE